MGRLLEAVLKTYSEEFEAEFDEFANEHAHVWSGAGDSTSEQKLEYTQIYEKFTKLFDDKFEAVLHDQGADNQAFFNECRAELENDGANSWAVEIILATTDYGRFFGLMRNAAAAKGLC